MKKSFLNTVLVWIGLFTILLPSLPVLAQDLEVRTSISTSLHPPSSGGPVEQMGMQLDELSQRYFRQKQQRKMRAIQDQEALIEQLSREALQQTPITYDSNQSSLFQLFSKTFSKPFVEKTDTSTSTTSKLNLTEVSNQGSAPEMVLDPTPLTLQPELILQKINEAMTLLPTDHELESGGRLNPNHMVLAGKIANALTILAVKPIGFKHHQVSCDNVIFRRKTEDGDKPSAIVDYYEHIAQKGPGTLSQSHLREGVEALGEVFRGVRCISNRDFSSVEASFTGAVLNLYFQLIKEGKKQVAWAFIDQTLPLAFLFFDAAKFFEIPQTLRIFCLRQSPRLPSEGSLEPFAFGTPEDPYGPLIVGESTLSPALTTDLKDHCDLSLMHLLLESPQNYQKSSVYLFGLWTPDIFLRGTPLVKMNLFNPMAPMSIYQLIQSLVDFEKLGEGNCPLQEIFANQGLCRTMDQCNAAQQLSESSNQDLLSMGVKNYQAGTSQTTSQFGNLFNLFGTQGGSRSPSGPLLPGAPGSEITHFGVPRADLAQACAGEGGGGQATAPNCFLPIGSSRTFSPDPTLNRIFQCTWSTFNGDQQAEIDFYQSPTCRFDLVMTGEEGDEGEGGEELPEYDPEDPESLDRSSSWNRTALLEAQTNLRSAQDRVSSKLEALSTKLYNELINRGYSIPGGLDRVRQAVGVGMQALRNAEFFTLSEELGEDMLGFTSYNSRGEQYIGFSVDLAHAGRSENWGEDFYITAVHEVIHAALNDLADDVFDEMVGSRQGDFLFHDDEQHEIIESLGFLQCDPNGSVGCTTSCTAADEALKRFKRCLAAGEGGGTLSPRDQFCQANPDACGDGRQGSGTGDSLGGGQLGSGCFVAELGISEDCLLVYCDGDGTSMANCCSPGGDGSGTAWTPPTSGPGSLRFQYCQANPDACGDGRGGDRLILQDPNLKLDGVEAVPVPSNPE